MTLNLTVHTVRSGAHKVFSITGNAGWEQKLAFEIGISVCRPWKRCTWIRWDLSV